MSSNETPIAVREVSKKFGDFVAVDSISFSVPAGTIFGLLGPNGAGKTTTLRMIMNITIPDTGNITIFGEPSTSLSLSRRIGYLPEERGLYRKMRVLQHLIFLGEIRGLTGNEAKGRAIGWLDRLGIGDWRDKKVEELSKGMQQKVQFIGCVLHDPGVIILDEPFSGLDPVNARVLKEEILRFREEGRTIVLSTHIMEQAEKLCDEIALINRSRIVLRGSIGEVKKAHSGNRMVVTGPDGVGGLESVGGVKSVLQRNGSLEVELDPALRPSEFLREATKVCDIESAMPHELSLDEIFVSVVSGDVAAEEVR